ncbi:hypothetical protein PtB15_8B804 [Puccinia triticina]|nr:hypothetical protein PtB15_8B804 [Puccinia triticina]
MDPLAAAMASAPNTKEDPPPIDALNLSMDSVPPNNREDSLPEDARSRSEQTPVEEEHHPPIPAPPAQSYTSKDTCFESIQSWAKEHGYAIVTARSYPVNGVDRVIYQCDRSALRE